MRSTTINLGEISILIADPNPYACMIAQSILRSFGSNRVTDVRTTRDAIQALIEQKVDLLICDPLLPPGGGLPLVRSIRQSADPARRMLPILVTTGDTRISTIKRARASGANMIVAKPMSPSSFYDRLTWVAFNPHRFMEASGHADEASSSGGMPAHSSVEPPVGAGTALGQIEPELSQNEIDQLFQHTRNAVA